MQKSYNGIGNNGDAHAVIDCVGATNIRAGSYAAVITGNVLLNNGTGQIQTQTLESECTSTQTVRQARNESLCKATRWRT